MGSRSDVVEVLGACRWSEEGSYLGEVAKSPGFPLLVKVTRGLYQNVGTPTFASPSLVSHLLLLSAGKSLSVAAQCVKFKSQRTRVVPFGPTLSIPHDFLGHFEILSEDGRSVPVLGSVEDLTRKFPDSCLIREPMKGYKPAGPPKGTITEVGAGEGYKVSDKTRTVLAGEVLVLVGEVSVPSGKNRVTRYLRCFDSKGQTVYLNSAHKGKFSPIARHDSISGVHTTKNILNKRMPMMVRVVDGKPPVLPVSNKSSSFKFVPELRLFTTIQEELIFGMPLSQGSKDGASILPLPLSVPLKFQVCRNMAQVEQMKEYSRLHEKMKGLVDSAKNLIQIYDINLKKELRFDGRQWKAYAPPIFLSASQPILCTAKGEVPANGVTVANYDVPDVTDYEDIDEIYDYVRGIKPPPHTTVVTLNQDEGTTSILIGSQSQAPGPRPPRRRSMSMDKLDEEEADQQRKPEPPPIETIPTHVNRRNLHRSSNVTMIVSSGPGGSTGSSPNNTGTSGGSSGGEVNAKVKARTKHLYVKKTAAAAAQEPANGGLLSGSPSNRLIFRRSPIFDCRYKSMNDLNRSSLESGASASSHKVRYFQHNHQALNLSPLSQSQSSCNLAGGRGIFRPKSLTNLLSGPEEGGLRKRLEMVMPNHIHAPPPPIDLLHKFSQSQRLRRLPKPPTLYL